VIRNFRKSYFLAWSLFIILALGGFSYLRNFIETGNPLYPLDFAIAGKSIFKGVMDRAIYNAHFSPKDYSISKVLFHEGLGLQTLVLVLPGIFLALPLKILKERKGLTFVAGYILILPLLIYLVYRYLIPLANLRYLYAMLGLGITLGFFVLKKLNTPKIIVNILVILCVLASMPELAKRQELAAALVFALFFFTVLFLFGDKFDPGFLLKRSYISIFFILILSFLIIGERWYFKNEFPRYLKMVKYSGFWPDAAIAWDWLNSHTSGNNIAYAGRPVPFPLYGSQFKNSVYYVSVNETEPAKLHYFAGSKYEWGSGFEGEHKNFEAENNYRGRADYKTWLKNLSDKNTDYLFIYSLHQIKGIEFPMEDVWAKSDPVKFSPIFSNATVHIYKVIK
jgi:hypothetical protein